MENPRIPNDRVVSITRSVIRAIRALEVSGEGDSAVLDVSKVPLLSVSGQTALKITAYDSQGISLGKEGDRESSARIAAALDKIRAGESCIFCDQEKDDEPDVNYESKFGLKERDVLLLTGLMLDVYKIGVLCMIREEARGDASWQKQVKANEGNFRDAAFRRCKDINYMLVTRREDNEALW